MSSEINDKYGKPINEGDHMYTPIRGGRHEGDVEKVVTSNEEAKEENVKNPPKVGLTHIHIDSKKKNLLTLVRSCLPIKEANRLLIILELWSINNVQGHRNSNL